MARVELRHVSKVYADGTCAVDDLSLAVNDGELLVLLGPSGCGKTTLLRMVAGLESVSAGELLIDGRVVNDWSPGRRNVAMVFQSYALYPHLSVRRNLAFPLRMQGLPKAIIAERVAQGAARLGLTPLLDRKPAQLSGGEAQRVAMGRALVRDPAVFLLDEPLSNLDAKLRVEIRNQIGALQAELGTTTLYVTHDQVEAMTLGHRVAVFRHGHLQQLAAPQTLYDRPVNQFVAGFIGSPPMNFLAAEPYAEGDVVGLRLGEHAIPLPVGSPSYRLLMARQSDIAVVGVRPEDFAIAPEATGDVALKVHVEIVENLGRERIAYFSLDAGNSAHPMAARLPRHPQFAPGDLIQLSVNVGGFHFFDAAGNTLISD